MRADRPLWDDSDVAILKQEGLLGLPPKVIARHFPDRSVHAVRSKLLAIGVSVAERRALPYLDRARRE
jgi:hypothetical protein